MHAHRGGFRSDNEDDIMRRRHITFNNILTDDYIKYIIMRRTNSFEVFCSSRDNNDGTKVFNFGRSKAELAIKVKSYRSCRSLRSFVKHKKSNG